MKMIGRIFLWGLLTVILLVSVAAIALNEYLRSNEEKLLSGFAFTSGLDLAFRDFDLTVWETFPRFTFRIDSLVLRDTSRSAAELPVLRARELTGEMHLGALLRDTIRLRSWKLSDGAIHLRTDSAGRLNLGQLFKADDSPSDGTISIVEMPQLDWEGVNVELEDMDFEYRNDQKRKLLAGRVHTLAARPRALVGGGLNLNTKLDLLVNGIAFNLDRGSYLVNTPLSGEMDIRFGAEDWTFFPAILKIGEQQFTVAADIRNKPGKNSKIYLSNQHTDYELTRALMHNPLREKLGNYHVTGRFPVQAEITTPLLPGKEPKIRAEFTLDGNNVRVLQYDFRDVRTKGLFVNRLVPGSGYFEGDKKDLHFSLKDVSGWQDELLIETREAILTGINNETWLESPLRVSGPAKAVSSRLGNTNFFFERGHFRLETRVNASLDDAEKMIRNSDGQLVLNDLDVAYRPADVSFPIDYIQLNKRGLDVSFLLASDQLAPGFDLQMGGSLANLTALLIDLPDQTVDAKVSISAPRIRWIDFLAFFGKNGYFGSDQPKSEFEIRQSMKTALVGLANTFQPQIEACFDTVAYYDIFAVTDFSTGLHFQRDTLVLERSDFDWNDTRMAFAAELPLGTPMETPFAIRAEADHLDLNKARPALEYFSLRLPPEIDSLPHDVNMDFRHRGMINDTVGLTLERNFGSFVFNDGEDGLLSGQLTYEPSTTGLSSHFSLSGDPQFVNYLFAAEDFFFGSGHFELDLRMNAVPDSLADVIRNGQLRLRIDSSRMEFRPAELFFPVERFEADITGGRVEYLLRLRTESADRSVTLRGDMDHLERFLYPNDDATFRVKADAYAPTLGWTDLEDFVSFDDEDTDTTDTDISQVLSATSGIFSTFQPDLSLRIDTVVVSDLTQLTNLSTGLAMMDSTGLKLERTQFQWGRGNVSFNVQYNLDEKAHSPFDSEFSLSEIDINQLLTEMTQLPNASTDSLGNISGTVNILGKIEGTFDEKKQTLLSGSGNGRMLYEITNVDWSDWPIWEEIGRKLKMKKRFRHLHFAPLRGEIVLDSGRIIIPRTEIQSSAVQLFVEGTIDPETGPNLLISFPLRNIGRGVMNEAPAPTGYAFSGWKVYLVAAADAKGAVRNRFRLGRKRFFREQGRLEEFKWQKHSQREMKRLVREAKRKRRREK